MNRIEKNRVRKRRRRNFFFSLFSCVLVLIVGVYAVNQVMIQNTALPGEKNILSFQNMGQALSDQRIAAGFKPNLEKIVNSLKRIWTEIYNSF